MEVSALAANFVVGSGVAQLAVGSVADGVLAKVYVGSAHLDIAGNPPARISAPREITLAPETRLPVQAQPLRYQDSDAWDHMYLSDAEVLSTQLGAAATGFDAQVPASEGHDPVFYQALLPALVAQPDFATAFASIEHTPAAGLSAKPGDYLIASVIALRGTRGTFQSRLTDELVFAGQGAPWGFVAYDQGVTDLTGVLNDVLGAIGRSSGSSGGPASQIAIGPPAASTPSTRPRTTPTTVTTIPANPRQPRPTTTTTTVPPPLIAAPAPVPPGLLGSLLNPLLDPLINALNNILSGHH